MFSFLINNVYHIACCSYKLSQFDGDAVEGFNGTDVGTDIFIVHPAPDVSCLTSGDVPMLFHSSVI